ncbi:MAG: YbjN domain-containing protein [Alphaproteobacteria bacterium]
MTDQIEIHEDTSINPIDCVEDVLNDHNWVYSRMNHDEILVEVAGKSCSYRLVFVWQEQMNALQLCCLYDMSVAKQNLELAANTLMDINEELWMGHFEIRKETSAPCFRQTSLLRGHSGRHGYENVEDLVDISLSLCERYQAVFHLLSEDKQLDSQILSFALMDTEGES